MEIPAEFFNVSFNKAMAFGYRTDDVDKFVTQALEITKKLQSENEALQQKLEVLASTLSNYREEEDSLRSALIGAQKLGDSILKESRHKAENMIREATEKANDIAEEASHKRDKQQHELEQIRMEAADFKEKLFALYRMHLDIIKNIPSDYDDTDTPVKRPPQSVQAAAVQNQEDHPIDQTKLAESNHEGYSQEPDQDEHDYSEEQGEEPTQDFSPDYTPEYPRRGEQQPDPHHVTEEPPYGEPVINMEASEEDVAVYDSRKERGKASRPARSEAQSPFVTPPMVQLEFDSAGNDGYDDDDEFEQEKKSLRESNLNRIPYLDDDDDDDDEDFAMQLTSKKKQVVSQKFGVLKFGDSFDLRKD